MSDDKKVVPFPAHRVKKKGQVEDSQTAPNQQSRTTLVMSLLSTVLIATFLASQMNKGDKALQDTAQRALASMNNSNDRSSLDDDIQLARKIARDSLRQPASRGHEPSAEEILRHGPDLASLYALRFDEKGALIGLKYQGPEGQKRSLTDREEFIRKNADLFKISFQHISREKQMEMASQSEKSSGAGVHSEYFEVYNLMDGDKTKAKVHFTLDEKDKLTQMNVEVF